MGAPRTREEMAFVLGAVTTTTLAQIFGLDHKDVQKRLQGKCPEMGREEGTRYAMYRIRDAAPYLVDPNIDLDEYIKTLTPVRLPPALQDAYWKAQLSRQKYEENRGELWRTERVREVFATVAKNVRTTILLFEDSVEAETDLTVKQREIIRRISDGMLQQIKASLVDEFELYAPQADEHGMDASV